MLTKLESTSDITVSEAKKKYSQNYIGALIIKDGGDDYDSVVVRPIYIADLKSELYEPRVQDDLGEYLFIFAGAAAIDPNIPQIGGIKVEFTNKEA